MVSFKQAFDAARKAGNRYFSWNGNDYNTMTKEEQNSGIGDYFSKFKSNVGDNSNFQKAASNMGSQMMGVFQNPTKGKYAGQPISYNAEGGLLKFDDGGTMEDFKKWLNQKLSKGELEESDLSKEKLAQLYQTFKKEQQGVQTAMNGAKLNYINQLNGKCPQGTHLSYYRIGGTLCKKCEADAHNESSDPIKAFKQKCGGKVKKKELGGEVDNKKPKLVKKPQSKPGMVKPTNKRPGPKDLKTLPNGKYPKYWTATQRGQWDRDHDEGD